MVFSSIFFICIFLPVVLLLYYVLPAVFRNLFLLIASLIFYAWGEPRFIILMIITVAVNYTSGLIMSHASAKNVRKAVLIVTVILNLGSLGFFKYSNFIISNINSAFDAGIGLLNIALPVGISFYTFQAMSYVIDVYRGNVNAQRNFVDFAMYISLFPQLIAGPIVKYSDIAGKIKAKSRRVDSEQFFNGLLRFSAGLGKKVLLANQIGAVWNEISALDNPSALTAWIGAAAFTFQIYFDFSGYSDMAIGMGKMLGFDFPENFNHPYEARSITDFWRRWHMTLSSWFKEYLYIPLGGNRCSAGRNIFNLFVVWALTGAWHGAGFNFILWGIYYFALLALEKYVLKKVLVKLPGFLAHLITLFLIVIGWVIFALDDAARIPSYLAAMFGAGGAVDGTGLYYLLSYGILIAILIICSTHVLSYCAKTISLKLVNHKNILTVVTFIVMLLLIAGSLIMLTGDSYNPFLYFRF